MPETPLATTTVSPQTPEDIVAERTDSQQLSRERVAADAVNLDEVRVQAEESDIMAALPENEREAYVSSLDQFTPEKFNEQIYDLLERLGENSPFFKALHKAAQEQGYTFEVFGAEGGVMQINGSPLDNPYFQMIIGQAGALTDTKKKTVEVSLRNLARLEGDAEDVMIDMLANEGVHILYPITYRLLDREKLDEIAEQIQKSPNEYTAVEVDIFRVASMELISHLAMEGARKQLDDPDFRFSAEDLSFANEEFKETAFAFYKLALGRIAGIRANTREDLERLNPAEMLILQRTMSLFMGEGSQSQLQSVFADLGFYKAPAEDSSK